MAPAQHKTPSDPCSGGRESIRVLFEDNHLLVVCKPAGIATMGNVDGDSVHRWGCDYLRRTYNKPGNVFLGIVSRLDRLTSGVLVLARTSKAASRLSTQFASDLTTAPEKKPFDRGVRKLYVAVAEDRTNDLWEHHSPRQWVDRVYKDEANMRMRVGEHPSAKVARANVWSLAKTEGHRCLAVELLTGRKHQIRLQSASRGMPLVNDPKYGGGPTRRDVRASDAGRMMLHCHAVSIVHPTTRRPMTFFAEVPAPIRTFAKSSQWNDVQQYLATVWNMIEAKK